MKNIEFKNPEKAPKILVINLKGSLDTSSSIDFYDYVNNKLSEGYSKFIINCESLNYVSSAGISIILRLKRRLQDKNAVLVYCQINKEIHLLFHFFGLDKQLVIAEDKNSAKQVIDNLMDSEDEKVFQPEFLLGDSDDDFKEFESTPSLENPKRAYIPEPGPPAATMDVQEASESSEVQVITTEPILEAIPDTSPEYDKEGPGDIELDIFNEDDLHDEIQDAIRLEDTETYPNPVPRSKVEFVSAETEPYMPAFREPQLATEEESQSSSQEFAFSFDEDTENVSQPEITDDEIQEKLEHEEINQKFASGIDPFAEEEGHHEAPEISDDEIQEKVDHEEINQKFASGIDPFAEEEEHHEAPEISDDEIQEKVDHEEINQKFASGIDPFAEEEGHQEAPEISDDEIQEKVDHEEINQKFASGIDPFAEEEEHQEAPEITDEEIQEKLEHEEINQKFASGIDPFVEEDDYSHIPEITDAEIEEKILHEDLNRQLASGLDPFTKENSDHPEVHDRIADKIYAYQMKQESIKQEPVFAGLQEQESLTEEQTIPHQQSTATHSKYGEILSLNLENVEKQPVRDDIVSIDFNDLDDSIQKELNADSDEDKDPYFNEETGMIDLDRELSQEEKKDTSSL
ncbi:MAG: STAS domain-containing protein [Spirochaetota bacterium]